MEELFRFYVVRAPAALAESDHIPLDTSTAYQRSVTSRGSTPPQIVRKSRAALDDNADEVLRELDQRAGAVRRLLTAASAASDGTEAAPVASWVREAFGTVPAELVRDREFAQAGDRLRDVLIALRLVRELEGERGADDAPAHGAVCPAPDTTTAGERRLSPMVGEMIANLRARQLVALAAKQPLSFKEAHFLATKTPLSTQQLDRIRNILFAESDPPSDDPRSGARATLATLEALIAKIENAARLGPAAPMDFVSAVSSTTTSSALRAPSTMHFTKAYSDELFAQFKDLITTLDTGSQGVGMIAVALRGEWQALHATLSARAAALTLEAYDPPANLATTPGTAAATPTPALSTPVVGGHMQLAGVANVHVFKHHVKGYVRGELAHIENVLRGETRTRTYRTLSRSEEDTETVSETARTEEREIKTEDHSRLQSGSEQVLKEDLSVKAGFDLQASIGTTLKLGFNTSVAYNRSKEQADKTASEYAKDVTNRAARKVAETVRTAARQRLLRETEEKVEHTFANTGADRTDVTGLYQWVEKVEEVRHYVTPRPHAVFDGVVLQPGQRLLGAPLTTTDGQMPAQAPPPVDVRPGDIHPWNYLLLAARHGATSVPEPPPLTRTASFSAAQNGAQATQPLVVAQDIALPEGYVGSNATVAWFCGPDLSGDTPRNGNVEVALGRTALAAVAVSDAATRGTRSVLLSGERGTLPFAATFFGGQAFDCTVTAACVRGAETYASWQLGVYAALVAAHSQAQQSYDERVARAVIQQSYGQPGPSAGRVDATIREELKRCALGVIARQVAGRDLYGRLDDAYGAGSLSEVARLCLLYEHAFVWDQMTYVLYPYFWADGRNGNWAAHTARTERDPDLVEFLKAGAARIVVPVREGFSQTLADGTTNVTRLRDEQFSLDDLLLVGSPTALAIEAEVQADGDLVYKNESWLVRTPTELVSLRTPDALPTWEWSDAENYWVEET